MWGLGVSQHVFENKLRGEIGLSNKSDLDAFVEAAKDPTNLVNAAFFTAVHHTINSMSENPGGRPEGPRRVDHPAWPTEEGEPKPVENKLHVEEPVQEPDKSKYGEFTQPTFVKDFAEAQKIKERLPEIGIHQLDNGKVLVGPPGSVGDDPSVFKGDPEKSLSNGGVEEPTPMANRSSAEAFAKEHPALEVVDLGWKPKANPSAEVGAKPVFEKSWGLWRMRSIWGRRVRLSNLQKS